MVTVIAPWTYHNWRSFHRFLPLSISAGALWQGSPEFYHLTQRNRNHLDIWANELNPQRNGGHDPHTHRWRSVLQPARDPIDPGRAGRVRRILAEEGRVFVAREPGGGVGVPRFVSTGRRCASGTRTRRCKLLNMFVARQLPIVALVALVFLAVRGRIRPLVPFVVVCAYFTLVHMITWSEMRYSEPLHPLLAIIVMVAGKEGFDCFAQRQPS